MKFISTILSVISCLTLSAQDNSLFQKATFNDAGGSVLSYRILYPENYDKSKKYPLVLFLHGAGERGNDNEMQLVHGAKLFLSPENRKNFPAIVVFPQCPAESFWSTVTIDREKTPRTFIFDYSKAPNAPLLASINLVKKLIKDEGVDQKRVYITGLSMGGMGTFEAVYHNPDLFAAAMPICGGGDASRYDKRVKNLPFWVFHGDKDPAVDVKYSREMVARLKELGTNVKYSEYPDVGHNSWDNAFAEPDYLKWMFAQKRK